MKGLMTKDFCLLLQRRRSFIIILLCGLLMSFSSETAFLLGWIVMIGSLFTLSTIAYDEHDNCFPFLMTLPASRRCYAWEKYVFGAVCMLAFWILGIALCAVSALIRGKGLTFSGENTAYAALLCCAMLILDYSIPLNLKYGCEKGRIYSLVFWGGVVAVGYVIFRVVPDGSRMQMKNILNNESSLIAWLILFTAAMTAASVAWSINIMKKKEF